MKKFGLEEQFQTEGRNKVQTIPGGYHEEVQAGGTVLDPEGHHHIQANPGGHHEKVRTQRTV